MICCINWRESFTISHKMEWRGYDDAINFAVKYFWRRSLHPQLINQLVMLKCFPATRSSWNLYLRINNLSTSASSRRERNKIEGVNSPGRRTCYLRCFSSNLTFANSQIYFSNPKPLDIALRTQISLHNNFAGVVL